MEVTNIHILSSDNGKTLINGANTKENGTISLDGELPVSAGD